MIILYCSCLRKLILFNFAPYYPLTGRLNESQPLSFLHLAESTIDIWRVEFASVHRMTVLADLPPYAWVPGSFWYFNIVFQDMQPQAQLTSTSVPPRWIPPNADYGYFGDDLGKWFSRHRSWEILQFNIFWLPSQYAIHRRLQVHCQVQKLFNGKLFGGKAFVRALCLVYWSPAY